MLTELRLGSKKAVVAAVAVGGGGGISVGLGIGGAVSVGLAVGGGTVVVVVRDEVSVQEEVEVFHLLALEELGDPAEPVLADGI